MKKRYYHWVARRHVTLIRKGYHPEAALLNAMIQSGKVTHREAGIGEIELEEALEFTFRQYREL